MDHIEKKQSPDEGPDGVDRWSSNGYGLRVDGIEVRPAEKEERHGNEAQEDDADER